MKQPRGHRRVTRCRCSYEKVVASDLASSTLTFASALAEPVDAAVGKVAAWQAVGEWLSLADIILDKEWVRGIPQDSLTAQLES